MSLLAFVLISAAQVAIPGPSTVFLINNSVRFGPRRAIIALSGDLAAIVILASLSAIGVGTLLAANEAILLTMQLGGAVYLLWLGIRYFRWPPSTTETEPSRKSAGDGSLGLWIQSFVIGISNPKAILFFAALFPQFLPPGSSFGLLALLVALFVTTKLVVLCVYALIAGRIQKAISGRGSLMVGRRLTGAFFIAFGVMMAWSGLRARA